MQALYQDIRFAPRWHNKHKQEKRKVLRIQFKKFCNFFIMLPSQIVKTGRSLCIGCWAGMNIVTYFSVQLQPFDVRFALDEREDDVGVWMSRFVPIFDTLKAG